MARHAIGLDIGTFAVRAAEVVVTASGPRVIRFGQLTLPVGAVVAGEVVDVPAVAATIRRLWERVGFRGRQVVLGVANQKVLVREAEMPAMSDADLSAALQFQDADILPIGPDEAYLDFQRLEDLVDSDGNQKVRLLLASAARTMVATHLEALELAGLRAIRIDPMPLALVRSIGTIGLATLEEGASCEALVCIGAGVTTVVVHEGGIPRFVRFLSAGAGTANEELMAEMDVDLDTAEALKRRVGTPEEDLSVGPILALPVGRLVEEINNSIRFYVSQHPECPVGRVLITGGGAKLSGLVARLESTSGIAVLPARPSAVYRIDAGLSEEEIDRAEPNLPTVIGLALATVPPGPGLRRINLLPPTVAAVREERLQAIGVGGVVAVVTLLLVLLWLIRSGGIAAQQNQAAANQAQVASLQRQVAALSPTSGSSQSQLAITDQDIRSALAGDVDWASLITQVADAMPSDTWITALSGQRGSAATPGTVSFQGMGFNQTSAAEWLSDLGQLDSLSDVWVSSAARSGSGDIITFSSTADLGPGATSGQAARIARYTEAAS
ncbi:MAG TPA: type IV pilus assembly protein PilM [Acidimicrobiales bacterium]|nr:type IV pilus assembly protein PilM [Acidimicrobiales bacterium]